MNIITKQINDFKNYGFKILKIKIFNRLSVPFIILEIKLILNRAKKNKKKTILIINGAQGSVSEVHRVFHLKEKLKILDIPHLAISTNVINLINVNLLKKFDLLFVHRVDNNPKTNNLMDDYKKNNKPIIFDVDDLVFDCKAIKKTWLREKDKKWLLDNFNYYLNNMKKVNLNLVPTDFLQKRISGNFGLKTMVLRNHLDQRSLVIAGEIKTKRKIDEIVTIGYFPGTATHQKDFLSIEKVLIELLKKNKNLRLKIVGPLQIENVPEKIKGQITRQKRVPYKKLMYTYADVDINLAPLEMNNDFCEGKSELKYFFAGCVGIPTIASATDAFKHAIVNGKNGFLCKNDQDWEKYLTLLVEDKQLRREMGEAAFAQVWHEYTPINQAKELKKILSGFGF